MFSTLLCSPSTDIYPSTAVSKFCPVARVPRIVFSISMARTTPGDAAQPWAAKGTPHGQDDTWFAAPLACCKVSPCTWLTRRHTAWPETYLCDWWTWKHVIPWQTPKVNMELKMACKIQRSTSTINGLTSALPIAVKWFPSGWTASGAQAHKSLNAARGVKTAQLNRAVRIYSHQPCRPSEAQEQEIRIKSNAQKHLERRSPSWCTCNLTCPLQAMYKQYCSPSLCRKEFLEGIESFSWKGSSRIIQPNCLTTSGLAKSYSILRRALSMCLLYTDSHRLWTKWSFSLHRTKEINPFCYLYPQLDLSLAKNKYSSFIVESRVS